MVKKHFVKSFKLEDLEAINALLKTNLSLKDSFTIIKNKTNKLILEDIIKRLDNGELIEKIINDYLPKDIKPYFMAFINCLSFGDSLSLALKVLKEEKEFKDKLIKEISYPLFLMVFVVIGIYLFNSYCFDALINSIRSFNSNLDSLMTFRLILDIAINIALVIILIALIILLFFTRKKRQVMAYILLDKYTHRSIIKEYLSSRFVIYFNACYSLGIKTKDTIDILKHIKDQPLISFLAFHIDEAFLKGERIDDALKNQYIDDKLSRFIKIAMYTNEVETMLKIYYEDFKKRFSLYMKKLSQMIQVFSYLMIGVIVIFIYQILFIPMGIIGGL